MGGGKTNTRKEDGLGRSGDVGKKKTAFLLSRKKKNIPKNPTAKSLERPFLVKKRGDL